MPSRLLSWQMLPLNAPYETATDENVARYLLIAK